jgi:molybdopterin molybdotransferase
MSACGCDSEQTALRPFSGALEQLIASAQSVTEVERVTLEDAFGRVLAEDVTSPIAVPPADNSAMDGYAVNTASLPADLRLAVTQRIAAGEQGQALQPGTAARIFTGSEIPPGADAVIMQEQCQVLGEQVQLQHRPEPGDHIRPAAQDIHPGQCVAGKGRVLDGRYLGVIAAVGVADVAVYRRVKVALLTTGDELQQPGETPQPGKIYNSNFYTLKGLLAPLGVEIIYPGIIPDDPELTTQALQQAANEADLVISSGGVSVGEEDHVKAAVEKLGELVLWRLAIKPGKPLAYGRVGNTPFIGLPGNPAAVLVTFLMLARPYLQRMQGVLNVIPARYPVKSGFARQKSVAREEFLRAAVVQDESGWVATPAHSQSSGVLSSAVLSDGLLVIPAGSTVAEGDTLEFIPFHALLG